jgi:hypothetical protein
MTTQELFLAVGGGGWVRARFRPRGLPAQTVYLRFAPEGDRWQITELWWPQPRQDVLRSVPLSRIEHAVNASGEICFGLSVGAESSTPADLVAHFKDKQRKIVQRVKLKRPTSRRLTDDFYKSVARAYGAAVEAGRNPRKTLAEDSGTPADTVARWILEARRRGYLPPAEPGKVSAKPEKVSA